MNIIQSSAQLLALIALSVLPLSAQAATLTRQPFPASSRPTLTAGNSSSSQEVEPNAAEAQLQDYYRFINSPEVRQRVEQLPVQTNRQTIQLDLLPGLQDDLRRADSRSVLLYPMIFDDRLELILVTPDALIRRTVNVSRAELNRTILEFRQAVQNPSSDVKPSAQQLYRWLIQPLDAELTAAQAETILYAPDGALRYVPLAALHDQQQWFVERFNVNNITAASLTDFNRPQPQSWHILAGALTEGSFTVPVEGREMQLAGFPYARQEVDQIASLFPGSKVLLNQALIPAALRPQIAAYNGLHLAIPTVILPDGPDSSFMLFGNGERLSLRDLSSWNLSNLDLVVLSSCETGLGSTLGNGEEILGLGYQFQQAGARAVIASLWVVDDRGTQVLMGEFYRALSQNQSVGQSLRLAQLALLQSQPDASRSTKDATIEINPRATSAFNHPFYWAPFILIGNGL